jgi:hypothetical protein
MQKSLLLFGAFFALLHTFLIFFCYKIIILLTKIKSTKFDAFLMRTVTYVVDVQKCPRSFMARCSMLFADTNLGYATFRSYTVQIAPESKDSKILIFFI